MKTKNTKITEKVTKAKAKISEKAAKVSKKAAKACALLALLLAICGCATSEPASRSTSASYGDIVVRFDDRAQNNTGTITIGDGALASADSAGSTETTNASPTNDVKPDIDVSVPVNKAGAGQSVGSVLGDAVAGLINGTTKGSAPATSGQDCTDGSCSEGACSDGSCTP